MTAVEELAYRIQTGNIDPARGAAILERLVSRAAVRVTPRRPP